MRAGFLVLPLVLLMTMFVVRAEQESGDEPEPRRVLLPADSLASKLELARQGILVKMPLTDYEDRLRRFRDSRPTPAAVPRLVETVFKARLHEDAGRRGEAYLTGSASWTVLNPAVPAVLPLSPLTLALQKTRFENREALVGDFDGEQPGLLLDQTGKQTVLFDWTARGEHTPAELTFDWRVPPAPLAQLELNLPVGRSPSVAAGCLIAPPEPAETPDRRLWKIRFGNRSALDLTIRPLAHETPASSPGGPLVIDSVRSRHELTPEGETSEFAFDLRISARGMRSLAFACDAPLQVYQAELQTGDTARVERLEWQPGTAGNGRSLLTLHFREALSGVVRPRLYCRAVLPAWPATWTCPGVVLHPGNLIPRTETIDLRWSSPLRLENWQTGDYRISDADPDKDGMRSLTLTGSGLPGGAPSRPRARLRSQGADAHARTLTWLQAGSVSSTLDVQIVYEIRQGRLFEEQVWIAPGWEVEQVSCSTPGERLRTWSVKPAPADVPARIKGGKIVVAELQPPLEAVRSGQSPPVLSLRLRGQGLRGGTLPLPIVVPAGAATLDGILGIDWDEAGYEGTISMTPPPQAGKPRPPPLPAATLLADEGPWGKRTPLRHVTWKGQPPLGMLTLRHRLLDSRARSRNDVFIGAGQADVTAQLTLEVLRGAAETIELRLSTPLPAGAGTPRLEIIGRKEGDDLRVQSLERSRESETATAVSLLAGTRALGLAGLLVPGTGDERWRVVMSRPLPPNQPLVLGWRTSVRLDGPGRENEPFRVPLLTFAERASSEGEVRLFVEEGEPPAGILFAGLERVKERMPVASEEAGPPFRVYRHTGGPPSLAVRLVSPAEKPGRRLGTGITAVMPRAELLTRVDPDGRLVQLYTFTVSNWPQPTLPLRLPEKSRLVALRIDGRDATSLAAITEANSASRQGPIVDVPVPRTRGASGPMAHQFALVYVVEGDLGRLWGRLNAPAPLAPLEPLAFRRVWRLPAGVTPIGHSSLARLPGPPLSSGLASWSLSERLPAWSSLVPRALVLDRWAVQQEQAVRAADARFRRAAAGQTRKLGEALRQLASGLAEQGIPLVIDGWALDEKGLTPGQPVVAGTAIEEDETSSPVLQSLAALELVYVPGKPAALVTSRRQALAWERADAASEEGGAPRPVLQAMAAAASHGHDESGRFQTVPVWLEQPSRPIVQDSPGPALEVLASEDELAAWTDWVATPGADDILWVVRARAPAGAGLALALLFLAWAMRIRHQRRLESEQGNRSGIGQGTLAMLLGWLALSALGVLWLPAGLRDLASWPLAAAILVGLWWYLAPLPHSGQHGKLRRSPTSSHKGLPAGTATAGVLALFWTAWSAGPAAQPAADRPALPLDSTVYLIPGRDGGEPASVLVSPGLLKRLERRPAPRSLAEAVLVDAEYQAVVRTGGRSVHVDATLQVYCPGAGPASLILPLDGVKLDRDPLLDGAPASPSALPPPRSGDVLRITGEGMHKVQLSFVAAVKRAGDQSDLMLGIPRTTQGRFSLRVPGKDLFVQSLVHLGAQKVSEDAMGTLLDVDIGPMVAARKADTPRPAIPLHFRWTDGQPGRGVPVQYREAYLWDLGQRGHTLAAVVLFDVGPGAVERLTLDVPPELVVHQLEASRPRESGKPDSDPGPVALRDWRLTTVKGASLPQLQLDFQSPVAGLVQMTLTCYPRASLFETARSGPGQAFIPTLPVPRPHGTPARNGSFLAYRLQGVEAERGQLFRLSGLTDVSEFTEFFRQATGRREAAPTYASRIDRVELQPPVLPLRLRVLPARRTDTSLRMTWHVGLADAELLAVLEMKAPDADLALIECDVPAPVEITAVRGPDVRDWSTHPSGGGQRLQIWLRRAAGIAHIELRGSVPLARLPIADRPRGLIGPALATAVRSTLAQAAIFSLPAPHIAGLERSPPATTIELIAADGLMLAPRDLRNLSPEGPGQPLGHLTYTVRGVDYGGQVVVTPGERPSVRLITFVELTDRQLTFRSRIEPLAGGASMHSLEVRLRGWPGSTVRLEAPEARVLGEEHGQGAGSLRAWNVRNERSGTRKVVLSGSASLDELAARAGEGSPTGLLLPDIQLAGVTCVERWMILNSAAARFRLEGGGAKLAEASKLPEMESILRAGGRAWRMDPEGGLTLLVEADQAEAAVQVVAREYAAAVLDQRRWSYQSAWWLFHDGPAELVLTLPPGTKPALIAIDGVEQPAPRDRDAALRIPLRGAGARHLVVRWLGTESTGSLPAPEADLAHLNIDRGGPAVRVLTVPAGNRLAAQAGMHSGPLAAAQAELERAAGQQRLALLLLESLPAHRVPAAEGPSRDAQFVACQQRLARHLWNAEQVLKGSPISAASEKEYAAAIERLQDLREQQRDLLRRHGREMPRLESGDGLPLGGNGLEDLARSGKVYSRVDSESKTSESQPVPALIAEETLTLRRSLGGTGLLVCFLVVVWVLASFPPAVKLARVFWPEEAVVLGLVGLRTYGPSWVVVFLLALGVVARVLLLGAALVALVRRWRRLQVQRA